MLSRKQIVFLVLAAVVLLLTFPRGNNQSPQKTGSPDAEKVAGTPDASHPVGPDISDEPDTRPPAPHQILELPEELKSPSDILKLVELDATTHRAIISGDWHDPKTWGGQVPLPGARVHVAGGVTVTLGDQETAHLKSLRVDGKLILAPQEDTQLTVDTLVVNTMGSLIAGTADQPLAGGVEALISLEAYTNPNDTDIMRKHSAQMIALGEVSLHGQPKSGMGLLSQAPLAGDRELVLDAPPVNWREGDFITIGGNRIARDEIETLQISYVKENRIGIAPVKPSEETWKGLAEDYDTGKNLRNFVVNYSRNVGIASPPPGDAPEAPRGAVVFQGEGVGKASLGNLGIYGLGETDAMLVGQVHAISRPAIAFHQTGEMNLNQNNAAPSQVTAPVLSTDPNAKRFNPTLDPFCLTPGGTVGLPANRTGETATGPAAQIMGMAIVDAPENGIAINNSAVSLRGSVAYDQEGGAWLTPNGSPSRLVWTAKRSVPSIVGGGLP